MSIRNFDPQFYFKDDLSLPSRVCIHDHFVQYEKRMEQADTSECLDIHRGQIFRQPHKIKRILKQSYNFPFQFIHSLN